MEKHFIYRVSEFDFELINHIKKIRESRGITKEELSKAISNSSSLVGNIESLTQRHKYSTTQIGLVAIALGYNTIGELLDFPTPSSNNLEIEIKKIYNQDNTKVIRTEVVDIKKTKIITKTE